jgi:Protein of unknown function (DUF3376)/Patatin-like phospholipase
VALALNGGVSLAVWMGGCAVELDCARRAHLGPEDLDYDGYEPGAVGATGSRRLYAGLCRAFGRRLSLDVLTGASAGGINGALLAAAMTSGRRLHPKFVRERWLDLGDLSRLLLDPAAKEPRALMDGDLFHRELLRAFRAVRGEAEASGAAGEDEEQRDAFAACELAPGQRHGDEGVLLPDLDVTMTDVAGTPRTFPDEWGGELFALEHAPRFKFRGEGDYTVEALAAAARTSASFPVAFEPWQIDKPAAGLAGIGEGAFGIDGGVLDNAPIRAALDLVPFRFAETRVQRYACYMNADPAQPRPEGKPVRPEVEDVIGYVVNLPRTAPFVDQLYAVRAAVNRPFVTQAVVQELLQMDLEALEATAGALLPAYRRRRAVRSIEELLPDPVAARAVMDAILAEGATLPWIPAGGIVAPAAGSWEWGIRAAQRVLYLLLDLLRVALEEVEGDAARAAVLEQRADVHAAIDELETAHGIVTAGLRKSLEGLAKLLGEDEAAAIGDDLVGVAATLAGWESTIYGLVADRAETLQAAEIVGERYSELFAPLFKSPPAREDAERAPAPLEGFFRRVLAIEVVRRSLADDSEIDTAQKLRFVQLTPATATPILTRKPLTEPPGPADARQKLTGVGLAHFAGFYRRSWRANDFMWGRLDAAARVVDLLLDRPPEPGSGGAGSPAARAAIVMDAVLPTDAGLEERWLAQEAMADHGIAPFPEGTPLDAAALRSRMEPAIAQELELGGSAPPLAKLPFTQAVCARAAQLEAIRDELPVLIEETKTDAKLGSSGKPLDLGDGGLRSRIEALREAPELPERLTGKGEAVSDLGLGTIAHASRVGISMLQSTAAPLTKPLGIVRVPAIAVAGIVARGRSHRLAAACGFSAAAIYLSSRIVTAEPIGSRFSDAWSLPVLLSLVAALVVVAAVGVPALQAAKGIARARSGAGALGFAACGGTVAAALGLWAKGGGLDLEQVLLCPGAENPDDAILVFALAATAGLSALRLSLGSGAVTRWLRQAREGRALCWLMIVVAIVVAVPAAISLWGQIDGGAWRTVAVLAALPGAPVVAGLYLQPWRRRAPTRRI